MAKTFPYSVVNHKTVRYDEFFNPIDLDDLLVKRCVAIPNIKACKAVTTKGNFLIYKSMVSSDFLSEFSKNCKIPKLVQKAEYYANTLDTILAAYLSTRSDCFIFNSTYDIPTNLQNDATIKIFLFTLRTFKVPLRPYM